LDETSAKQRYENKVDAIEASKDTAVASTDDTFALSEHVAEESVAIVGVPGSSDPRTERAREWVVRILLPATGVPDESKAEFRVIHLTLQGRCFTSLEVRFRIDLLASLVHEFDLTPVRFDWGHFERPSQTVG
jgi:hypothetical protein